MDHSDSNTTTQHSLNNKDPNRDYGGPETGHDRMQERVQEHQAEVKSREASTGSGQINDERQEQAKLMTAQEDIPV